MTFTDAAKTEDFLDRYVQVWHEPDPATRKELVVRLWAADAVQYTNANEYRGHEALEERVATAYRQFVEQGGYVFRPEMEPATHHGAFDRSGNGSHGWGGRQPGSGRSSRFSTATVASKGSISSVGTCRAPLIPPCHHKAPGPARGLVCAALRPRWPADGRPWRGQYGEG